MQSKLVIQAHSVWLSSYSVFGRNMTGTKKNWVSKIRNHNLYRWRIPLFAYSAKMCRQKCTAQTENLILTDVSGLVCIYWSCILVHVWWNMFWFRLDCDGEVYINTNDQWQCLYPCCEFEVEPVLENNLDRNRILIGFRSKKSRIELDWIRNFFLWIILVWIDTFSSVYNWIWSKTNYYFVGLPNKIKTNTHH